jgi:hypothetical protein
MSNPADYFMTLMSIRNPNDEISDEDDDNGKPHKSEAEIIKDYSKQISFFTDEYNKSALKNDYAFVSKDIVPIHATEIYSATASWMGQLGLLTKRSFNNIIRLPEAIWLRVSGTIVSAVFIDIIFQELKGNL